MCRGGLGAEVLPEVLVIAREKWAPATPREEDEPGSGVLGTASAAAAGTLFGVSDTQGCSAITSAVLQSLQLLLALECTPCNSCIS